MEQNFYENKKILKCPTFVDVHVHLREPGFCYKETIATGTAAAKAGGYGMVFAMPNLDPVPDSLAHLQVELDAINRDSVIPVLPYGAITVGQKGEKVADLEDMSPYVCAFSDDGHGVQNDEIMKEAMTRAKKLNRVIVAHCEVNSLLKGGYIHDGRYAATHNHRGICSASEWKQVERDIALVEETGCAYHVCHVSTKETVALVRQAKKRGLDVTCETTPHYLLLTEDDLQEDGRFKMNPPVRTKEDKEALIEGIIDGTIDMIATDHAPHSTEEKSRGLEKSAMGIVGLETAFPLLYTYLVHRGVITLNKLFWLMAWSPRKRFGLPQCDDSKDFCLWDISTPYRIAPENFKSKGHSTPFEAWEVYGAIVEE